MIEMLAAVFPETGLRRRSYFQSFDKDRHRSPVGDGRPILRMLWSPLPVNSRFVDHILKSIVFPSTVTYNNLAFVLLDSKAKNRTER